MPTQTNPVPSATAAPDGSVCKSCSSPDITVFYRAGPVPVNSCFLLDDEATARRFPTGQIALGFCRRCGFIGNLLFDPELTRYNNAYEEQQSFSPRFNAFAQQLALELIERYGLKDKTVLEIGCGKGDFLVLLCEMAQSKGIGIDPTYLPSRPGVEGSDRVSFIQDFYSRSYAHLKADFVCCRHTLEHIPNVAEFMQTVRDAIGDQPDIPVFFELPDVLRVLKESAFWDIYYEHCSYFSLGSLARLFRASGFDVLNLSTVYDGQYLLLDAKPSVDEPSGPLKEEADLEELSQAVDRFRENHENHVRQWRSRIEYIRETGQRAVVWGSGSKCVAFLSTLGITDEINVVVDINPHRQGRYLPSTAKRIYAPSHLAEYRPDVVIVMNPIYLGEIRKDLQSMGLNPEVTAV